MTHDRQIKSGHFITFEGGEGVGKSTQIKHLALKLQAAGYRPLLTREPGGSPLAERLREILLDPKAAPKSALAQSLLFFAARSDHLDETIRPALATGTWVLCDRFADSTRAYQGAAGGLTPAHITTLEHLVVDGNQPDLTILLDLDPKIGLARAEQRRASAPGTFVAADTYEGRRLEFHQRLRDGFLEIARNEPKRVVIVDAFRNELTIADEIWTHVSSRFDIPSGTKTATL